MDDNRRYEAFVRNRITELREQKGVSEHRMSLELGKSGSYIRSITNGISMPSLRELFNIMEYFDLTPTLFFAPMDDPDSLRGIIPLLVYPVHSASSQVLVTRSLFASQSQMYWFAGVVMGTSSPGS